jgi:hypothetical protein
MLSKSRKNSLHTHMQTCIIVDEERMSTVVYTRTHTNTYTRGYAHTYANAHIRVQ